jgi:hypothetical protein
MKRVLLILAVVAAAFVLAPGTSEAGQYYHVPQYRVPRVRVARRAAVAPVIIVGPPVAPFVYRYGYGMIPVWNAQGLGFRTYGF